MNTQKNTIEYRLDNTQELFTEVKEMIEDFGADRTLAGFAKKASAIKRQIGWKPSRTAPS